jgi:ESS family glutamate:Na+ symporter
MDEAVFSPWALLVDAGLIGALLALGTLLRAKVKVLQSMMIRTRPCSS